MKKRTEIINYLINRFNLNSYLEIGVRNPDDNFNKINIDIKIGVDPEPKKTVTHKMTSDNFFKNNNKKFDIIFVDGLHTEKQSFLDVTNSLNVLNDDGFIIMHDCNPPEKSYIRPLKEYNGGPWCGTVFRAYIKKRYELEKEYNTCVINEETGIGIITKRIIPNNLINYNDSFLEYDSFSKNRKKILNMFSFEDFKKNLK